MRQLAGLIQELFYSGTSRSQLPVRSRYFCGPILKRLSGIAVYSFLIFALALPAQINPRRIVSTAPSITETLFALGVGDRVVGVSRFCNYPPEVQKLPKVGSYIKPDVEAIARLLPDLVILQQSQSEQIDRLIQSLTRS
jgi:iron complex transport system substrate-binding protein